MRGQSDYGILLDFEMLAGVHNQKRVGAHLLKTEAKTSKFFGR